MAENKDKELAYRVLCGKTPVLDVYFDGSYKIRTDIPEEERSESAKGFHRFFHDDETIEFQEMEQRYREDHNYYGEREYSPPSEDYLKAYRTLQMFDCTPEYMSERDRTEMEIQVFGGADVPWGRVIDGFLAGAVSVYISSDGYIRASF